MLVPLTFADFFNSLGGGKFLFSSSRTSIALSAMVQPPQRTIQCIVKTLRILLKHARLRKSQRPPSGRFAFGLLRRVQLAIISNTGGPTAPGLDDELTRRSASR